MSIEIQAPTTPFDLAWQRAPRSMRNYTEEDIAAYWFAQGGSAERERLISEQNEDMREMLRVGNERIGR